MTKKLTNFLAYARTATYASGKEAEQGEGKRYFIEKGEFAYQDVYYDQTKIFQLKRKNLSRQTQASHLTQKLTAPLLAVAPFDAKSCTALPH